MRTFGAALGLVLGTALGAAAQQPPAPQVRTAEQVFKNITILKDTPANQIIPVMHLMENALGVDCEFCHVGTDFAKDGKKPKEASRWMITLMRDINKNSFEGKQQVTCYTCHHGISDPLTMPVLPDTMAMMPLHASEPQKPVLPTADQILAKYVQALGGEQAIRKITSRAITITRDVPSGPGGVVPMPAMTEQYVKAPNLLLNVVHTPAATVSDGFDGKTLWTQDAKGVVAPAPPLDSARAARSLDLQESLKLKQEYTKLEVRGTQIVGDRQAYLVVGFPQNDTPEQLLFDTETGLLLRRVAVIPTPIGDAPYEVDYDDYRDTGSGVKIPFAVRMIPGSPRSSYGSRSTVRIQKVQDNVPIEDAKFVEPQSKPAPAPAQ
jgi:photosynthetic reaction center cytochrome c subunit